MGINSIGLTSALVTFLGIAFGHIAVRRIEFRTAHLWVPSLVFIFCGLILEILSLYFTNLNAQTILGILGVTVLWDAVELFRQQNRVRRGHAPANPHNPRHRRFLEEPNSFATTIDVLKDENPPYFESRLNN